MKNKRIQTRKETAERRKQMETICYSLKIQSNKLSNKKLNTLDSFFKQAKWLSNAVIGSEDIFSYDYKLQQVQVKWFIEKEEFSEIRQLNISSQIKQSIINQIIEDIKTLSKKKKKGQKVGTLKFKKAIASIPIIQFGVAWDFGKKNTIRLPKIGKVKVNGLGQIDKGIKEWGPAKLIKKPSGYYIHITGFKEKEEIKCDSYKLEVVGLDFGIKDAITLSTGEKFNCSIPVPKSIKRLQRKKSKKQKKSNNSFKLQNRINRKHERITNKKEDFTNKLIHYLTTKFNVIIYQNDSLKGWHSGLFGKQVQASCLGRIKSKLKKLNTSLKWNEITSIEIDRFEPSTKQCYVCGQINNIGFDERVYKCGCGLVEDRDTKSAKMTAIMGLKQKLELQNAIIPREPRDFKSVERLSAVFIDSIISEFKTDSVKQETTVLRQW